MTAAKLKTLEVVPETHLDAVKRWRFEELLRAGYDEDDATVVAFHAEIDLHYAADLVRRGCPSSTAVSIVL